MTVEPTRADLLELIDWLWTERHDAMRAVRPNVPAHETPYVGWTLEAALAERQRSTDPREEAARTLWRVAWNDPDHPDHDDRPWASLTEQERNRWRRAAGAPQYQPTPRRPRPK